MTYVLQCIVFIEKTKQPCLTGHTLPYTFYGLPIFIDAIGVQAKILHVTSCDNRWPSREPRLVSLPPSQPALGDVSIAIRVGGNRRVALQRAGPP